MVIISKKSQGASEIKDASENSNLYKHFLRLKYFLLHAHLAIKKDEIINVCGLCKFGSSYSTCPSDQTKLNCENNICHINSRMISIFMQYHNNLKTAQFHHTAVIHIRKQIEGICVLDWLT